MPTRKISQSTGHQKFDWPLTGKLRTDVDPMLIGETNFRSLINMRYSADCPKGIQGMTPINAAALDYTKIINGFHFRKDNPSESHVFVQATSGANSKLYKSNNTAAIPNQDTFSLFATPANANPLSFSNAPNGAMVALNGDKNYIWSGEEAPCSAFIVFDPNGTFWYDYTDKVNNSLSDSKNVASMPGVGGGIDANAITVLHLDNNVTDSGLTPKTFTNSNVTFSDTDYIFGGYSAVFNGTNAKITTPYHTDFAFSGGNFSIDGRIKVTSLAANNPIYYQNTTTDADSFKFYVDTNGALKFDIKTTAGGTVLSLASPNGTIAVNTWYFVAVVESGSNYYLFVGPTAGAAIIVAATTSAIRCADYTGVVSLGYGLTGATPEWFVGKTDETRVSRLARWTVPLSVPLLAYSVSTSVTRVYVGSVRPLQAIKPYPGTANGAVASSAGYEWNGSAWTALTGYHDGTELITGKTLSGPGKISFTSTVSTSKLRAIKEGVAYFYQFVFTGVDTATTIYMCTVDAPIQEMTDLWDGAGRTCLQCFMHTSSYTDYTTNVAPSTPTNPKAYVATSPQTYAQFGGLTSAQSIKCGFSERLLGIRISMPDALYVNANAAIMSVDYWNGLQYITVGAVDDSTSTAGKAFNHSGIVLFNAASENTEFQTNEANDSQFYYYRIRFSGTLSADVRVDNIEGITAQKNILPYQFPVFWQNRVWLLNQTGNKKHTGLCSAYGTNCVFNGNDSVELEFGDDKALVCGETLFSRFGDTLYDNMVVFKKEAVFIVAGTYPGNWQNFTVSDKIGCLVAATLKRCDMSFEVAVGITKHALLWRSARGIEFFDGNTVSPVSGDIYSFFDPASPDYIDPTIYDVSQESAFYDELNFGYHWLFTNINGKQEWIFNLRKKAWSQVNRGTGKALNCGFNVQDATGSIYPYAGTSDGFIERLEYGTTFHGNSITYTFWFGDNLLALSGNYTCKLRHIKLFAKVKNISAATIAVTHYGDTALVGTSLATISQKDSTHRLYQAKQNVNLDAVLHSLKYEVTTNNETIGFEPQMISGLWEVIREDL